MNFDGIFGTESKDPKWKVRRGMAISAMRLVIISIFWILGLWTYAVIKCVELPNMVAFATALGLFSTCCTAVITKYIHDASREKEE